VRNREETVTGLTQALAALAVGRAIAASFAHYRFCAVIHVADDWVTLHSAEGGFHVLMPRDWEEAVEDM
jgi:hypothetical protein